MIRTGTTCTSASASTVRVWGAAVSAPSTRNSFECTRRWAAEEEEEEEVDRAGDGSWDPEEDEEEAVVVV